MNLERLYTQIAEAPTRNSARKRAREVYLSEEIRTPGVQKVVQSAIERVKRRGTRQRHTWVIK